MAYFVEYAAAGKFGTGRVREETRKTLTAAIHRAMKLSERHGMAYVLGPERKGHICYINGTYDHQAVA